MDSLAPSTQSLQKGYPDQSPAPSGKELPQPAYEAQLQSSQSKRPWRRRKILWIALAAGFIVVVLVVVLPVVFLVAKKGGGKAGAANNAGSAGDTGPPPPLPTGAPVSHLRFD